MSRASFFPSATMASYVGRMFLIRSLAILALLVIVLQTLDLLGESGKILAVPTNGDAEVWRYLGLRLPQIIARFLPFSVLLGTIITLATLNQNSEVVAMKSGGMSAHQVLAPLILVSAGIAAFMFVFNERVVTRSNDALDAWQKVEYRQIPKASSSRTNVWAIDGNTLINAGTVLTTKTGVVLEDVSVYERTNGTLTGIVRAKSAVPDKGAWRLENASRFMVDDASVAPLGTIIAGRGVSPDRFSLANVKGDNLAFLPLRSAIKALKEAGRATKPLEASLWHKISGPLSTVLMPLLGAVAAFGLARSGKLFVRAVAGMGLGFAYFVVDNFALAMGNLGAYPPLLAAWGPFVLFLLLGEAVLVRTEE